MHLVGIKLNFTSYKYLGQGIEASTVLKQFIFQNTNLASGEHTVCCSGQRSFFDYLHVLTDYLQNAKSLETIDLQCNNLSDKHHQYLTKVVCSQYELKDILRWKLGLRCKSKLNINRLGIKSLLLSRNNFSDTTAYHLS